MLAAKIVVAARDEFAEHGWAGTTIRAVARAADVDPALVYHYFGTKERLLDAATNPPQKWLEAVAKVWTTPTEKLGTALVQVLLASWSDEEIGPTMCAILQTAAHEPTAREKLRRGVVDSMMNSAALDGDERDRLVRSGLIASQMVGFALIRYVWKMEPLASMPDDEVIAAIAPNLQRYVDCDLTNGSAQARG
ncbi:MULTISPECIES: TetR family transcriptional regulator [unclassified Mycobacterium]|uniref:TetR/AcrR family transcriptional regulator n=1 Tax=unclassified Mycobacterium TaxID=2642494 RepID=UPI0009EE0261|nr:MULTISPECIES: TetR family transcriptional regulator [unclassified Mycobacterium]